MQNSSIVCVIFDHSLHFSTIAYINLDYSLQFSYDVYSSQPSHANLYTLLSSLACHSYQVPRHVVEQLMRELDSEGIEIRRSRRLWQRTYRVPGPNYCWHTNGYDKLKPYGFPIHGCMKDGVGKSFGFV